MQYQTIQSPLITSMNNFLSFETLKSKQLPTYTSLANKCLKIINILSPEYAAHFAKHIAQNNDLIQVLNILLDNIYELLQKNKGNNNQICEIETLLQKQQNLNRALIKKELQHQEHYKLIIDQLSGQKGKTTKLIEHISKLHQQIKDKQLAILHAKNELKASQKQRKILDNLKGEITLQKKFNSYLSKQIPKQQPKITMLNMVHKRRKSEQIGRKTQKSQLRKKQKQRERDARKSMITMQNKISYLK